ncbi:pyridoxal phosphate-dependent transferase [Roridomyces roridus]|uniref:Pyridoxal phosphate-dependent transferase n=1 Tax=Roridomyces roridus TaxID=1738132 RepID=A0AAD7BJP0_9AGAR|nr:pyridoxal phosphate-dependent transferase [Roridomyces roridus]
MSEKRSNAVDLSHHLSDIAKTLEPRSFGLDTDPGSINLDGGAPDIEYFPIESLQVQYLKPDAFPISPTDVLPHGSSFFGWIANMLTGKTPIAQFVVPRRLKAGDESVFELKTALSYSGFEGLAPLQKTIREWVTRVHKPAYNDYKTLIDLGATCAWNSALTILLNPGEAFLTDRYAYNTALAQGITRDARVLATWDEKARGLKRPRVIYTQGGVHNPAGILISAQRKRDIYDVAVRYDLVVIEDDPYYFQQASTPYIHGVAPAPKQQTDDEWLDGLVPSFLQFDYQGRVLRLDTFSKSLGPGGRVGYYTGSPLLISKLLGLHQAYLTFPSGLSQAIFGELLHRYKQEGFTRWLRGITAQYELRRNWAIDTLYQCLDIRVQNRALVAYAPTKGAMSEKFAHQSLLSFIPPDGGMFIWFAIHLHNHPRYQQLSHQTSPTEAKNALSLELFTNLINAGVVMRRGELFAVETDEERASRGEDDIFLRAAFSSGTKEQLEKGFKIFAAQVVKFFQ